ncbi:DBH-like monooxygenase protein 1 [Stegodyphus dumicola]|uniref:DBH-like monooxygenase protein 1 n=1 Tax=Stegodyphus dumicola TaxID=202533 RepID=UPI0015B2DE98|nr:DBH-like monooxygenase protein 1 [Stegodyphus dumicola]
MRLIYAYSDKDPTSEDDLEYHFQKRGSKSVLLLQQNNRHLVDKSSLLYWDVLSPNFKVPSEYSTMYWCKIYKSPQLSEKHHIILVEPLIQKGHENIVHHLLMYECVGAAPDEYNPHVDAYGHQCHRPNMPDAMKKCEGVFLAWAVGGEDLVLPEHVGLPLDPSPSKYYMLEIHYDNPFHKKGIVDQSGFRIYYTPDLREYDAGSLMIGSTISARMLIPPGRSQFVVAGHGNPNCLESAMPEEGVKLFGVFLHAHLLGRRIKARHFRNRTELPPLAVDSNYDFNYQEYRYYQEEVSLLPGDQVTVECTYDSSGRNETTFGGESTRQEMCLVFFLYYPRIERFASLSVPILPLINTLFNTSLKMKDVRDGSFYKYFRHYNWEKTNLNIVENSLRYAMHDTHCYLGNGEKTSVRSLISYPEDLTEYKISTPCGKGTEKSRRYGNKEVPSGVPNLRVNSALLSYLLLYSALPILWQGIQFLVVAQ